MGVSIESYGWASDLAPSDLGAAVAIHNAGWQEWNPLEREVTTEAYVDLDRMSAPPERYLRLLARDGDVVVGLGQAHWRDGEPGACLGRVFVSPAHRRHGVATALVGALIEGVRAEGRIGITLETVDGSVVDPVMERHRFTKDLVLEQNWTDPRSISDELLDEWIAKGERADGYELVAYDAPCPDDLAEDFVHARFIMNDAPRREGEPESQFDVAELRGVEETSVAAHHDWWNVGVRHVATGELVGISEMYLPVAQPWIVLQGDTGVAPAHRGHALGAWMKAVNHRRLNVERPVAEVVSTWNASANAPMLRINHLLGFHTVQRYRSWYLPFG